MKATDSSPPFVGLKLPHHRTSHWRDVLPDLLSPLSPGAVELDCGDWEMNTRELQELERELEAAGHPIRSLQGQEITTVISGNALGIPSRLEEPCPAPISSREQTIIEDGSDRAEGLRLHQGTLRSGDHLQSRGHVLLVGDVNPGARISAGGNVLVWGRLRGMAHAGCTGDLSARIVALQLRPLQLRIGESVARGPEDQPQPGLAEQARIVDGDIVIEPADVQMPLPPLG